MKVRNGFVSNSSSSSFVVDKEGLNDLQIYAIHHYMQVVNEFLDWPTKEIFLSTDEWIITETKDTIDMRTFMDNFDMYHFLIRIGVPEENIHGGLDRDW